jgi:PAS domain S-box-containing protein
MAARHPSSEDVALSLTLAVVASSPAPLLLLDGDLTVIAASRSFCDAFGATPADLTGRNLYTLSDGAWDMPQLRLLMGSTLSGEGRPDVQDMTLKAPGRPARHLVVQARRLSYLDGDQTHIQVATLDVTEVRIDGALKDAALRQTGVLLREVRHRVANSLQIIASVLLQNARKTSSDETRSHLKDAHNRVMSVAALERLLSSSQEGNVDARAYFTSLCHGITTSLISETDPIVLAVEGGDGVVEARVLVGLGLIVTELVINALKHAFPDGRPGKITIDYDFHGPNWILCVRDDGVGIPVGAPLHMGLGASIVRALAGQLHASVTAAPEHPGTKVSIEHIQIALVLDDPQSIAESLPAARSTPSAISG